MISTPKQVKPTGLQSFKADEVILFPGEPSSLYRLKNGLIRIHTVDDDGNGLTLRYVKPGGFFGEEALLKHQRKYFAEAITFCEVEILNPMKLSSSESQQVLEHLAAAVEGLYLALHRLSGKRLKSRIAAELLELQDSALANLSKEGKPVVRMTHDALAAAVGSVRETVTKVVGELAKEGAISAGYGKISLLNLELLRKIADE